MSDEARQSFACFGGTVAVHVAGPASDGTSAVEAALRARARLEEIQRRLTRFDPASELSRLNADPEPVVPASPLLRWLARATVRAGELSGGLVDATQLDAIERAGYRDSLRDREPLPLATTLSIQSPRRPGGASAQRDWARIRVDDPAGTIARPPGLRIDGGGLAKGMAADLIASSLRGHDNFAVDCCGDIRLGGRAALRRLIRVSDPFGPEPARTLALKRGAIATSGIGGRAWNARGGAAHHLIDPASGRPAFTGLVQATALAPTALLAEIRAKAALLAGSAAAARWLPDGGVIVAEDGGVERVGNQGGAAAAAA
ncbi:MAG TPA: FAD:protein FMN transferase [Solirubrobacterales bacterium]|nr:FAD:protein FMN transferase [Solirubrobacterales bacterium]